MASVDDLATLSELDENNILMELQARYKKDIIYTYIGDILIAVNPYKAIPIYEQEKCVEYTQIGVRSSLPPHIFAISDSAFHNMIRTSASQCCVVSGESGAGKTESTKLLIQHIAHLCSHGSNDLNSRIVQVNPLMEAFGNAQTVLNYNSSRFGKYIELMFNGNGALLGAKISEYLLEKSRVVSQSAGERNFHIFYYLFAGLDDERMKANLLRKPEEHRIVSPILGGPVFANQADKDRCRQQWLSLMEIMAEVGFSSTGDEYVTVDGILAILAAIVHIGDIEFVADPETDGVYIKNDDSVVLASQLLAVNYEKLLEALISTVSSVGGGDETVTSLKTMAQATDGRDALAKALYGRLFSWIVCQINEKLSNKNDRAADTTIGILDIYGFENFTNNSFEQLCINITNEQLQCFFNEHIFRWEIEEYQREGISGSDITYVDNQKLLDFFLEPMKPMGLFALLDDEVRIPRGTDQGFVNKLTKGFPNMSDFKRSKGQQLEFTIQHFAGQVIYNAEGFLEKNRDTLSENFRRCMRASEARLVFELFSPVTDVGQLNLNDKTATVRRFNRKSKMFRQLPNLAPQTNSSAMMNRLSRVITQSGQLSATANQGRPNLRMPSLAEAGEGRNSSKTNTLGNQFKNSLQLLMKQLILAEPHFVRCVKPNTEKAANSFNQQMVIQQLRYTGVLETVKIRKQGYPTRLTFDDFMRRYQFIGFTPLSGSKSDGSSCRQLLESADLDKWQLGHSKVFLKYYHVELLNGKLANFARRIAVCQRYMRGFVARRKYEQQLKAAKEEFERQLTAFASLVKNANDLAKKYQNECKSEDDKIQQKKEEERKKATERRKEEDRKEEAERRQEDERKKKEVHAKSQNGILSDADGSLSSPTGHTYGVRMRFDQAGYKGTMKVIPPVAPPPIPLFAIREDPPAPRLCQPDCRCAWKNFSQNATHWSSSGAPDTAETLLSDTIPKLLSLPQYIWAKIYVMEKNAMIGKFYLNGKKVTIDDSINEYTGTVCGVLNSGFTHLYEDPEVRKSLDNVKEGVKLIRESDNSVSMVRLCEANVTVRTSQSSNHSLSREIIACAGALQRNTPIKVFDMTEFKGSIANQLKQTTLCDPSLFNRMSVFNFSIGRDGAVDTDSPLWIVVVNIAALDLLGNDAVLTEILMDTHMQSISDSQALTLKKNWQHLRYDRPGK